MEITEVVSKKIGNQSKSRPSNTIHGHIRKECTLILQGHLFNRVHSSIIDNNQKLVATYMPLNQRMVKEIWNIYKMEYYSMVKKKDIVKIASKWMQLAKPILNEVIQPQKENIVCVQS